MKYFGIEKDILATLTYFHLFSYPLKKGEIFVFLGHSDNYQEFELALYTLVAECQVFKLGDFYSLTNNYKLAERRRKGNDKALLMLKKAERAANIISCFPYIKGVAVSGSLSKYYADEHADIDFFIITTANRLWVARSFLHLFKKLTFLFNKQDHFCMNYFISEGEQDILEKNIYTATEVVTIMPLRGRSVFESFYEVNNWTRIFFPNKYRHLASAKEIKRSWLKKYAEKILGGSVGDKLDNYLMNMTAKSWNAKTSDKKTNHKGILMSMHVGKHFSKPNPDIFQKNLLQRYHKNLEDTFYRYECSLHPKGNI